jgi:hypothetical protein
MRGIPTELASMSTKCLWINKLVCALFRQTSKVNIHFLHLIIPTERKQTTGASQPSKGELPRHKWRSFLPHRPTLPPQPKGWEGRYWVELNRRHSGWHPPCTLQKNKRSVKVPVQGETTVGTVEHSVLKRQVPVDSSTQETLTGGVVRWHR